MTPKASSLMAGVILAGLSGAGIAAFSSLGALANPFGGVFTGSADPPGEVAIEDINTATLGNNLSFRSLVLTQNNTTTDSLVLMGGRLRFYPQGDADNAYMFYNPSTGGIELITPSFKLGSSVPLYIDYILNSTANTPVVVDAAYGLKFTCKNSLPTCVAGLEGVTLKVCAAGLGARTRTCECTSDGAGSPAFAWVNARTDTVGSATTCDP